MRCADRLFTGLPASASRKIPIICSSLNRLLFMFCSFSQAELQLSHVPLLGVRPVVYQVCPETRAGEYPPIGFLGFRIEFTIMIAGETSTIESGASVTRREFVKLAAATGIAVGAGSLAWAADEQSRGMPYRSLGRTGERVSAI